MPPIQLTGYFVLINSSSLACRNLLQVKEQK